MTALSLKREKDVWVCPNEGYVEVARLHRRADSRPGLLEVRAEHLKDYLWLVTWAWRPPRTLMRYRSFFYYLADRSSTDETPIASPGTGWPRSELDTVAHIPASCGRSDVHDLPKYHDIHIPTVSIWSSSWEKTFEGRKLFMVTGKLWRNEWIEPAETSPRIRRIRNHLPFPSWCDEWGTR